MRFSVITRPKFSSTLLGAFLIKNDNSVKRLLLGVIRFYQKFISPALPPSCRFYPTCSHYGYEAIEKYGPIKGGWLAVKRISRCHPFNPGGHDPVP